MAGSTRRAWRSASVKGAAIKGIFTSMLWLLLQPACADLPIEKAQDSVQQVLSECVAAQGGVQGCIDNLYARGRDFLPGNETPGQYEGTPLNWGQYQYLLALLQRSVRQRAPMGDTVSALVSWKQHAANAMEAFRQAGESEAAMWSMVLYIEGELSLLYGDQGELTRQQAVQAYQQLQNNLGDQYPAVLEYFAVTLALVHPLMDPGGQGEPTEGARYYQQAETYALADQGWDRVVQYRLLLDSLDTQQDQRDAIADFALDKGLRTRAVALLVQASQIMEGGVQNFDSPEIQLAQQRLQRGCKIASSDLEQFLCDFYRGQMAVRLGDVASASAAVDTLDNSAGVLSDPAWLQYLNVNELAATLSRIAYESGDDATAASLMGQLVQVLLAAGQAESGLANEIYNLAFFSWRSGEDPLANAIVQQYLSSDSLSEGIRDDFHHLAAAHAYSNGDITTAIKELSSISGDSFLGLSGYYRARIIMLQALQGNSDDFLSTLRDGEFYSLDYALRESAIALLEVREDSDLSLSVKGEMFPLYPRGRWFVSFAQAATAAATHLVAVPTGDDALAIPELVVDSGAEQSSRKMLSLTSDGKTAVICTDAKTCSVRESDTGRLLRRWQVGDLNQAFLADDKVLVTHYAIGNGTVKLWDLDSGSMLASYGVTSAVGNTVYDVPGDQYLILVNENIDVLNYLDRKIEKTLNDEVFHRFVSHPDKQLLTMQPGRRNGEVLVTLLSGNPAGQYSVMDWQDVQSHFVWWSIADNQLSEAAPTRPGHWWADLSPGGDLRLHQQLGMFDEAVPQVIMAGGEPKACNLACLLRQDFPGIARQDIALVDGITQVSAPQASRLLAETREGDTVVVDTATGKLLGQHGSGAHRPEHTVVSPDGAFMVSLLPQSSEVSIWSMRRGREIRRLHDNYARGLQWIDERLWAWQGDALMWLPMTPGAEWTKLDIESDEPDRFPDIEQLEALGEGGALRILEDVYLSDMERHRFQVRQINMDGSGLQRLAWSFVDQARAHSYSPPVMLPGARRVAFFSDDTTLTVASLDDGKTLYSAPLDDAGGRIVALGEQAVAVLQGDRIEVHPLAGGDRWSSSALLGHYRSATLDRRSGQVLVTEDLGRRSRILRFALADGEPLGDQLYSGSLQVLYPVAGGKWWLGEESDGGRSVWPASLSDPLIRFWSLIGNDWLVVDGEGRYDSSAPGDLDALSWVLSDAPRTALPLQAFMKDFYQPGLMQRHLAGETFPTLASVAALQRSLPRVRVESVKAGGDGQATVTVQVDPEGAGAVADLRLFRNGQLVGYLPEQGNGVFHASRRKKSYRFQVALPQGDGPVNFSAYAFNVDGVRSERAYASLTDYDAVVATPRRAFVITVGVNRYQNPAFNLSYAANDARAFNHSLSASLEHTGQVDEVVSIPLISEQGNDGLTATRDNLAAVLAALAGRGTHPAVPSAADSNDSIIVTFSGHGYADQSGRFHFLLEDIGEGSGREVTESLLSRTFTSSDLEHYLRDVDAQGLFLVIDACNSAASIAEGNFKPGPMGSKGLGQLAYDKAMMVITATQTEDVAMESQALQHGMLTYALVNEGIERGRADQLPADQSLWMGELFEYGQNRVPTLYQEVIEQGGPQNGSGDRGLSAVKSSSQRERWLQQPSLFDFSRQRDLLLDVGVSRQ